MLQKHKMSLQYIKEKLIESIEVIAFFNIFHPIQTCLFSWGYNGFSQHGEQNTTSVHQIYGNKMAKHGL